MAKRPPSEESKDIGFRMQKVLTVLGILRFLVRHLREELRKRFHM